MSVPKIVKVQGVAMDDVIAGILRDRSGYYVIELDEGTVTMWGRLERVRDDPRIMGILAQLEEQEVEKGEESETKKPARKRNEMRRRSGESSVPS